MPDNQALKRTVLRAAVFVPEAKPLADDIVAADVALEKLETVLAPIMARAEKNEPVFIEIGESIGAINAMLPELAKAFGTLAKLRALAAQYQARIEAAGR
jgi:ABC-type Fe3+-hydroxamate transport system substrate-binding protein